MGPWAQEATRMKLAIKEALISCVMLLWCSHSNCFSALPKAKKPP